MSWYREGVITLTNGSKTVIGTGTAWLANVVASSGLKTPTGIEEIESVSSNGALQLVLPYAGASASNVAYAIIPTQGLVPKLTKGVGDLLSTIGVMKDAFEGGDIATAFDLDKVIKILDLAAGQGAAMVGYDGTANYAVGTLGWKLSNGITNVTDFPWLAKFDGVTDDGPAINACLAAAGVTDVRFPGRVGMTSVPIVNQNKNIHGAGQQKTYLRAMSSMSDAVLLMTGRVELCNMTVDAANVAPHCVRMSGSNGMLMRGIWTLRSKLDAVVFSKTGNNSNSVIDTCLIRTTGTVYTLGTCSGAAGGSTLNFVGNNDLTTLGLRVDQDYIGITGDTLGVAYEITAVTATTLSVYPPLRQAFSGASFRIIQGSCVAILRNGDNSRITVRNSTLQGAPVAGLFDQALYGAISQNNVIEANGFGRIIGRRGGTPIGPTYDSKEDSNYYEVSAYRDVLYAYALGNVLRIGGSGSLTQHVFSGSLAPTAMVGQGQFPTTPSPAIGIAFPATQVPSSDVRTLDDYYESAGTVAWTPVDASPAGLTFTGIESSFTKIGRQVTAPFLITFPTTATANAVYIGGLPFVPARHSLVSGMVFRNSSGTPIMVRGYAGNVVQLTTLSGAIVPNSALSGQTIGVTLVYDV
jgi:hypothetical protein